MKKQLGKEDAIKTIQTKLMSDGNTNLLFGQTEDGLIGISHDFRETRRNTNVLVLSENDNQIWKRYILPNLLAVHSSAVIVCNETEYAEFDSRYKEQYHQDHNSSVIRFHSDQTDRYNPISTTEWKPTLHYLSIAQEADDVFRKNCEKRQISDLFQCFTLLKFVLLYVINSAKIPKEEKNFETVLKVLLDFAELGKDTFESKIEKYTIEENRASADNLRLAGYSIINPVAQGIYGDLRHTGQVFFKDLDTPYFSIDLLAEKQGYLFIVLPDDSMDSISPYRQETSFFISLLFLDLYAYREYKWKKVNYSRKAKDHPIVFYLNHAKKYAIPHLAERFATNRNYSIGISLVTDPEHLQSIYGDNLYTIEACSNTIYFGRAVKSKNVEFMAKIIEARLGKKRNPLRDTQNQYRTYGIKSLPQNKAIISMYAMPHITCNTLS